MSRRLLASCLLLLLVGCDAPVQIRKANLIQEIRSALLASVAAEQGAVLATTEQESQVLADESLAFAETVNRLREELRALVVAGGVAKEIKWLDEFDTAWAQLEAVDRRLLSLDLANSNFKALGMTTREGAPALGRFVDALAELQRETADPAILRTLSQDSVAALRVHILLLSHIPAPDGAQMTSLEQRMQTLGEGIDRDLAAAGASSALPAAQVASAAEAWRAYREVLTEAVQLSRANTNVLSLDLSVHEKRRASEASLAALAQLAKVVNAASRATR